MIFFLVFTWISVLSKYFDRDYSVNIFSIILRNHNSKGILYIVTRDEYQIQTQLTSLQWLRNATPFYTGRMWEAMIEKFVSNFASAFNRSFSVCTIGCIVKYSCDHNKRLERHVTAWHYYDVVFELWDWDFQPHKLKKINLDWIPFYIPGNTYLPKCSNYIPNGNIGVVFILHLHNISKSKP